MKRTIVTTFAVLALCAGYGVYSAEQKKMMTGATGEATFLTDKALTWQDAGDKLPKGAKLAVLEGDPSQAGPYTLRLKFPANYKVAPHTHPTEDRGTVVSGTLYIGLGDKFEEKTAQELPAGSFFILPKGVKHYTFTKKGATLQLSAVGPMGIEYLNPAEDPSQQKTQR